VSAHLVAPGTVHSCSMCPTEVYAAWGELSTKGWRSHYAGGKVDPIVLCPPCKAIIDTRREYARLLAVPAA
jgi:hypothetical protein